MGTTNHREAIEFIFGNVVTSNNHFRNGVLFEDFLYGIDCSKDRITIHLFALISKIIIDKADRLQIQAGIIKKLIKGINSTLPDFKKSNLWLSHFPTKVRKLWLLLSQSFGGISMVFRSSGRQD